MRARNRYAQLIRDAIVAEMLGETMAGYAAFKDREDIVMMKNDGTSGQHCSCTTTNYEHWLDAIGSAEQELAILREIQEAASAVEALPDMLHPIEKTIRVFVAGMASGNVLHPDLGDSEWFNSWDILPEHEAALRSLCNNLDQVKFQVQLLMQRLNVALNGPNSAS